MYNHMYVTYVCVCNNFYDNIYKYMIHMFFLMSMVSALLLVWQETSGIFGNEATNQVAAHGQDLSFRSGTHLQNFSAEVL